MLDPKIFKRFGKIIDGLISKIIGLIKLTSKVEYFDFFYSVIEEYGKQLEIFTPQIIHILAEKSIKVSIFIFC